MYIQRCVRTYTHTFKKEVILINLFEYKPKPSDYLARMTVLC